MTVPTYLIEDITNAILTEKLAKVRDEFSESRDKYLRSVRQILIALEPILDHAVNEKTLSEAMVLKSRLSVEYLFGESKPVVEGIMTFLSLSSKENQEKNPKPLTRQEIIVKYKLSPAATSALDRGVTIRNLLLIQPSLFI